MSAGRRVAALLAVSTLCACGGARSAGRPLTEGFADGSDLHEVGPRAPRVRWTRELTVHFEGRYVPVETARAALDGGQGVTYVGSSRGTLWALDNDGGELYSRNVGDAIDGPPALDAIRDELYVVNARGQLHALRAGDGSSRFEVDVGGSVSTDILLAEDALYLVTDTDVVLAISRKNGSLLWRYRRDPIRGLGVAGHAGLLRAGQRLVTGFSDGSVVALDPSDGRVAWELDTTLDVDNPEDLGVFVDVDATPVAVGDTVYVASVTAGVYVLDLETGNLRQRLPELTGVTGMAVSEHGLIVASSDLGVLCLDLQGHAPRWHKRIEQGAPGTPVVEAERQAVYVAESRGALLALALADGREVGRLESAHGFTATPALREGRGAILSNAGWLYGFHY